LLQLTVYNILAENASHTSTESQKRATLKYAKDKLKRIPLDVQTEQYEQIKAATDATGEKVNAYIKKAVSNRMESEGFDWPEK